jgi:transposase
LVRHAAPALKGTGTLGAALARLSHDHQIEVLEVNRPYRAMRRSKAKSDPTYAENAARAILFGRATAISNEQSGAAEATRAVRLPDEAHSRQRRRLSTNFVLRS